MHQDMSHWMIYNLKSHHLVSRIWDIFLLNLMPTFSSSDRSETRNQFMDSLKVWPSIEKIVKISEKLPKFKITSSKVTVILLMYQVIHLLQ